MYVSSEDSMLKNLTCTGKSLSEALIFASTNPQYDNRLFIVHENCKLRIPAEHVVHTNCCFCFDIQNNFGTQHIQQMFLASEKDLPVINIVFLVLTIMNHNEQVTERSKCSNGHLLRLVGCYLGLFKRLKITRTLKVTNKLDQLWNSTNCLDLPYYLQPESGESYLFKNQVLKIASKIWLRFLAMKKIN